MSFSKTRLSEHLRCNICKDTLTTPRVLPCAHSFCEGCLKTFLETKAGERGHPRSGEIRCPTCRKSIIPDTDQHKTAEEWLVLFPPNYSIIAILEDMEREPDTNSCPKHSEQTIKQFCVSHNMPACLKCLLEDHNKSCEMLDLERSAMVSKYMKTIKDRLSPLKEKFESISETMKVMIERRNNERNVIEEQLSVFKANVLDMVKRIEDRVTSQIDKICSEGKMKVQGNNQLIALLDSCIQDIDVVDADYSKTSDKLRNGAEHVKRYTELVRNIGVYSLPLPMRWDVETETTAVTELLDKVLNKKVELHVTVIRPEHDDINRSEIPPEASNSRSEPHVEEYSSRFEDPVWFRKPERVGEIHLHEKTQSYITGSAFLPDGRIALSDHDNNKILFYTHDFEFDNGIQLKRRPWGITLMPKHTTELLVTFPLEKLIVVLDYVKTKKQCITLPVKNRCYGITTYRNQIFTTTNDDKHAVIVLDLAGRELWRVDLSHVQNINKCTYSPIGVSINESKGLVYVACQGSLDSNGALVTMDTNGMILRIFTKDLKCCHGCSVDMDGNLYVCCYKTSRIFAIDNTGDVTKHILQNDKLNQPIHIQFFPTKTTFLLSDISSIVKIYELKTERSNML